MYYFLQGVTECSCPGIPNILFLLWPHSTQPCKIVIPTQANIYLLFLTYTNACRCSHSYEKHTNRYLKFKYTPSTYWTNLETMGLFKYTIQETWKESYSRPLQQHCKWMISKKQICQLTVHPVHLFSFYLLFLWSPFPEDLITKNVHYICKH